jgi:hypothetical protein
MFIDEGRDRQVMGGQLVRKKPKGLIKTSGHSLLAEF